ncbi:SRPBCC family protein [Glycomyces dulcitolivorans]|uniref:SRPBCC family protein n=1 Tax=Glycomyces dulcitolivorans TaxID=2200759 RepID=UPI000DD3FEEE|nr:SRPBCC family protein [Glycomyces dulcitolivorans]
MERIDRASKTVAGTPAQVYAAIMDPDALVEWLPPEGMTGRFEHYDPRPGGTYRLTLTYADASGDPGKSTADSDTADGRFVELVPGERIVQAVDFVSDDPDFTGTMTMTWTLAAVPGGTRVEIAAADVPPGVAPEDHAAGMASTLDNLAAYLAR